MVLLSISLHCTKKHIKQHDLAYPALTVHCYLVRSECEENPGGFARRDARKRYHWDLGDFLANVLVHIWYIYNI